MTQLMLPGFTEFMPGQIVHCHGLFSDEVSFTTLKANDVVLLDSANCETEGAHVYDVIPDGCGKGWETTENYVLTCGFKAVAVDNDSYQTVIDEWRAIYADDRGIQS